MTNRARICTALLLGSLAFGLSNTAVWSAWLRPPGGYEPLFLIRSHDMAEYVTYLTLAGGPDWLGLSPALTFQATFYLFCVAGAWVLLYAMDFFLPTARQRWWSFAAMAAA